MADVVVVTESGTVTVSQGETIVTVFDGRGFKGDPGDSFDQTLNTTDAVEFAGLINNGLTFPTADGTAGQVIETDGAGVLSFVTPSGGDFLPLAGGTMTGNIVFDGTSGQFIGKGTFDTSRGGNYGLSIVCSIGYEFNWQAGWLITTEQSSATPRPLYLDSLAGTTLRAWDSSTSTGTEVTHLGITFADTTVQTTAYTGGAGVSSLTAGTGISLDVTTGDITVTNSEPDQTVTLANGTGITITGTYPSFTVDCDITQYTDTDARLALSAGTGISYDNATGIITNDNPDQTVTLTDGTGITITGTYPSFTIDCDVTQYTDTDARLALSAGTGISYDNATGIITNDNPDQTVTLTDGADITITGTYPSFTIAYSGTPSSGTVTKTSVVSANGFAGTVATDTTTPAITISTSITGLLKGNGTAISAATSGTDYVVPSGSITGNAATVTTNADLTGVITSKGNSTSIASQTGTGSKFVVDTSPTLVTPNIGVASGTSLTLSGDLTVNGTTTTIASTTLAVGDKNIVLASASTTDAGADGGGITLKGASDHTWNWIDATDAWTSSDHINLASGKSFYINGTAVLSATALGSGISVTATTNANLTGVITSVGNATSIASQTGTGTKFVMDTSPTLVTPVLGTPSSGDLTNCTFPTLNQNTTGNASTVTTNANLTGPITSVGNATSIASQTGTGTKFVMDTSPTLITPTIGAATATTINKITVTAPATGATLTIVEGATLTASATASVSGTNTGDNAVNTLYSGLVSNATHTGDATGSTALTVVAINGVLMSGLATGLLKNTTSTGAPSIAVAGTDYVAPGGALGTPSSGTLTNCTFPTLNQNTTGTAAGLSATLAVTSGGTGQTTATAGFNALAPSQTSNSGKYLKTDGTNTSWGTLPSALPVLLFDGVTTTNVSVANGSLPVLLFGGVTTVNVTVT